MGGARETALASSTVSAFTWKILTILGGNEKCHIMIMIETDLSDFVITMHSGLCEQYVQYLGLTLSGLDFLFRMNPRALWQQAPSELVLIPQTMLTKIYDSIWIRSQRCGCLVTWFCYQMIAKPDNKTAAPSWPDPYNVTRPRWVNGISKYKLKVQITPRRQNMECQWWIFQSYIRILECIFP